jgi:hypothetical protein
LGAAAWLCGCASYRTPGGPADFRALGITEQAVRDNTDFSIAQRLDRKPLAGFPAAIAVVRVQGRGYRSYTAEGYGSGSYTVVPVRDVETDEQFGRIERLVMVRGIAPLNRLVLPDRFETDRELREGAATAQADMLLVYTFDTTLHVHNKVPPLEIITLGLFPDEHAKITSTASAILMDTRNGYVYAMMEATATRDKLGNAWTKRSAMDQGRRQAESEAFDRLVGEFETTWPRVVAEYGPPAGTG